MAEKKYIDIEAAIKLFNFAVLDCLGMEPTIRAGDIIKALESIPAADVREVKKGRWVEDRALGPICSVCGETAAAGYDEEPWPTPYCPFCGARMEEQT